MMSLFVQRLIFLERHFSCQQMYVKITVVFSQMFASLMADEQKQSLHRKNTHNLTLLVLSIIELKPQKLHLNIILA